MVFVIAAEVRYSAPVIKGAALARASELRPARFWYARAVGATPATRSMSPAGKVRLSP